MFVSDPLENFNPEAETTLFMMKEAQARAYRIFHTTLPNLSLEGEEVFAQGHEINILGVGKRPFYRVQKQFRLNLIQSKAIFLRKDPPFDLAYLHHLYVLAQLRGRVYLMNDPIGIMSISEKIFPLWFQKYIPQTCITSSYEQMKAFSQKQKFGVVLKPLNGSGGRRIFHVRLQDSNFKVAFETLSNEGLEYVVCQEFLPAVKKGDKRVLLLGGEILGSFTRVPPKGSHRANLHSGGSFKKSKLSSREIEIAQGVGSILLRWGIDFAGIDLIGERLTEVNVTSPMGMRELNATQKIHSEKKFMDFVEMRIRLSNESR